MIDSNLFLCLVIVLTLTGATVGLVVGLYVGRHSIGKSGKPLGKLFIERTDVEPYVTGCWLAIEHEDDLKKTEEGQTVILTVSIRKETVYSK